MPVLLLGLLLPFVLLALMLAMERVERGLGEDPKDRRTDAEHDDLTDSTMISMRRTR